MLTRPADLADDDVADLLRRAWGLPVTAVEYAAVGFGSHHWWVSTASDRWFATVDDLDTRLIGPSDTRPAAGDRLDAALSTARSLHAAGCGFVVAPRPSTAGRLVEAIDDRYVLALYPSVEGAAGSFGPYDSRADRLAVVDLLVRLHSLDLPVPAQRADLAIPSRDRLHKALATVSEPWTAGPLAEPARHLLAEHQSVLRDVLVAYDDLVAQDRSEDASLVITHGEPHRGNVIVTNDGPVLIDWDTVRLAPPERDLWALIDEDPDVRQHYERASGRRLDERALQVHRLWWDLCEVSLFVDDLRRPHDDTDDTRMAWRGLQRYLDPRRWCDVVTR